MLQNLPNQTVPLFESGTVFICRTLDEWQNAHHELGGDATLTRHTSAVKGKNYIATVKATRTKDELYLTTVYQIDDKKFNKELAKIRKDH